MFSSRKFLEGLRVRFERQRKRVPCSTNEWFYASRAEHGLMWVKYASTLVKAPQTHVKSFIFSNHSIAILLPDRIHWKITSWTCRNSAIFNLSFLWRVETSMRSVQTIARCFLCGWKRSYMHARRSMAGVSRSKWNEDGSDVMRSWGEEQDEPLWICL